MTEILGNLLAGLGLFVIGVKFVSEHMKELTGRRLRQLVGRLTEHPFLAGLWGFFSGAVIQSTSAVTFIVISLISAGMISVRRAMPVVAWSNVGTSVLVLVAVLDLRLLALYLLAAAGISYYFNLDRSVNFRHLAGSVLGIGLLCLGLQLMKSGAAPLTGVSWFAQLLDFTKDSQLLAFFVGALVTFIAQSSSTVSVIAIALAKAGLLGFGQTIMVVYGAGFGSGLSTWFLGSNLRGIPKQLALFQVLFKWTGVVLMVALFYLEVHTEIPLVQAWVVQLASDIGNQMALVYLVFQLAAAIVVSGLLTPINGLLQRLSPATREEELSKPHFLYDQALEEPETALELAAREQLRLARHLPYYLDSFRDEPGEPIAAGAADLHEATVAVLQQVNSFTTELLDQSHSRETLEHIIRLQNRTEVLFSLAHTLDEIGNTFNRALSSPRLTPLVERMAEGLHAVLQTVTEALDSVEDSDQALMLHLTADRGELVERLRKTLLSGEDSWSAEEQQALFTVTSLFERVVWLLRRLVTLGDAPEAGPQES